MRPRAARRRRPLALPAASSGTPAADAHRGRAAATTYELLAPRMLGIALLAPYFLWIIGRSLADLPLAQRALSVVLRVAFIGAARARPRAPRAHGDDAEGVHGLRRRRERQRARRGARGRARRGRSGARRARRRTICVRLVTFAKRPRVGAAARDDAKTAPRHRAPRARASAARPTSRARCSSPTASSREGYLRARRHPLGRRADRRRPPRRGESRAASYGVKLFAVPYARPGPRRGRRARACACPTRSTRARRSTSTRRSSRACAQTVQARRSSRATSSTVSTACSRSTSRPATTTSSFKSKAAVPGEVTYSLEVDRGRRRITSRRTTARRPSPRSLGMPVVLYVDGNPARATYLRVGAHRAAAQRRHAATRCRRACARPRGTTSSS